VADDATKMRGIIELLTRESSKISFVLPCTCSLRNPAAAPDLAETYLLNPELIEQTWCQNEYASLALAGFLH